ncbi:pilin [Luteimonas sp. MJ204]|uniref:pilin n=1 Tax=Luteimonas sp. MJ145 TaxID=3129234 RepID=UPI0031BBB0D7
MKNCRGFTLIELMIVVAIIALLSALAMPAYQDYIARSQVTEAFVLSSDARAMVMLHYSNRSEFPVDNSAAGLVSPLSITGRFVESVTVARSGGTGDIRVLLGNEANARISGQELVLDFVPDAGSMRWNCSGLSNRHLPSVCR